MYILFWLLSNADTTCLNQFYLSVYGIYWSRRQHFGFFDRRRTRKHKIPGCFTKHHGKDQPNIEWHHYQDQQITNKCLNGVQKRLWHSVAGKRIANLSEKNFLYISFWLVSKNTHQWISDESMMPTRIIPVSYTRTSPRTLLFNLKGLSLN